MKDKFEKLFKMQDEVSEAFWDMVKAGQIDLNKESKFVEVHSKFKKSFDEFKEELLEQNESLYIHLESGSVYPVRPYVINEAGSSIHFAEYSQTVHRNIYGFK